MKRYMVCGYSAIGKSHADKGIKCQDNCYYDSNDNIVVAAIADGLSSSKHSDIASKTAVEFVVDYCIKNITKQDSKDKIIATIRKSFDDALFAIKQVVKESQNDLNDYDTTLTVAVLIEDNLYYGQIGDSGIVGLLEDGRFERLTEAQNGEGIGKDRPVYPLAAMSKWVFKKFEHKIKALFLATDGVLKNIQHPLLEGQQYNLNHKYLAYIYSKLNSQKDDKEAKECIKDEVEKLPPEAVDYDDKTLVVVINRESNLEKQSSDYYKFPTAELWREILKKYEAELYPYRTQEKKESTEQYQKNEAKQNDLDTEKQKTSEKILNKPISKNDGKVLENSATKNTSSKKSVSKSELMNVKQQTLKRKKRKPVSDIFIISIVSVAVLIVILFIFYIVFMDLSFYRF